MVIDAELYLNFLKYDDKLLVGKSLVNILKYACCCINVYGIVLQEWEFEFSLGFYESVLGCSIYNY